MASLIQSMAGMGNMTEQVIATDFLLSSKNAIINYATALAETATPEVRNTLRRQFDMAVDTHQRITDYMMSKGYYHAYNPEEQIRVDMKASDIVMDLQ